MHAPPRHLRRLGAAAAAAAVVGLSGTLVPVGAGAATVADQQQAAAPLTNLDHLDWLSVEVTPPAQEGHTTYRLAEEPSVGTLWTYAEPNADGTYKHVGGGRYDAATDTWGQGAFNADDMTRAAVVYLRHWQQTGDATSRDAAYQMLRGVTYLQTATGPNAGNVLLWMQPDGTLNPSAEPVELPDPSDSDASYWLARTIWALGEGYAAFADEDPAFAAFLRDRLELAVDAVDRQVLDRYGEHLDIDGAQAPAWLVADGGDASAEAVLGLAAYQQAGGSARAGTVMDRLAEGIADLAGGSATAWPFGAVRPWALSRSLWHGWGAQMPAALARAGVAGPAVRDSFTFDPWLLTSGGHDNGRLPGRIDRSQIAYGADSRLQSLLATAAARPGTRDAATDLAGVVGSWYFGANPAGVRMYDPATGRTFDGINNDGTVNHNSGAESTIHGLLSMLALDDHPAVAQQVRAGTLAERVGSTAVEAETGRLAGGASAVAPDSLWTGESQYGGTGYVDVPAGGSVRVDLPRHDGGLVLPVVNQRPGSGRLVVTAGDRTLGSVEAGDVGERGDSPAPALLLPLDGLDALPRDAGSVTLTARGGHVALDAVIVEPAVSRLVLDQDAHGTALLRTSSDRTARTTVSVPGDGRATVTTYDGAGRRLAGTTTTARTVAVAVPAGGFATVRR
ncbi:hypothetical protein [Nocardioides iriomotensis]|uniref:Uncharacterized protein n=1 Tax=Nocardioides iriomotensis TaxID=715784 RepID=A0A4Q5J1D8_9ACTN|nr:hypothetical protein [Nocardioides iriomotensis]RYU12360.1 hypothetical protein ETU37_10135 [Nocardioides iriomotensis]